MAGVDTGCPPKTASGSESGAVFPPHRRLWAVPHGGCPSATEHRTGLGWHVRCRAVRSVGDTIGSIGGLRERLAGEGQSLSRSDREPAQAPAYPGVPPLTTPAPGDRARMGHGRCGQRFGR